MSGQKQQPSLFDSDDQSILARSARIIKSYLFEGLGLLILALAIITILALLGLSAGTWLTPWVNLWKRLLGWGASLIVLGLGFAGWRLLTQNKIVNSITWARVLSVEVAAFGLLGLLSFVSGHSLERAESGLDGGLLGWGLAEALRLLFASFLPNWLANFLSAALLFTAFAFAGLYALALIGKLPSFLPSIKGAQADPSISQSPFPDSEVDQIQDLKSPKSTKRNRLPSEFWKNLTPQVESIQQSTSRHRTADLPPLDLLESEKSMQHSERHINQTAGLLEKTLFEFGLPAKVVNYKVGPSVTQFALEPGYIQRPGEEKGQKVRVSQISALQRDLALALSAQRLRIQAPVPGRSYVGVEIPNSKPHMVRLRSILESQIFQKLNSDLSIALGRDVSGSPLAADLAKMPHLLVAGTTGSGKSVLISAITACLVMNNSPQDLKLVMLDPKRVELLRFNGLPHLLGKVETDLDRITTVLRWVVVEMQRRYKMLEEMRVRDLQNYNKKVQRRKGGERLPRIVVLIDELADLMMSAAEHTESTLVRLAQMARATGIHLVLATQRPSTDVVTGLIKANFPARISFAVASAVDSRVILDQSGAETLLGRGDMLYLAPEAAGPVRSQGVMISDNEIARIISFWQKSEEMESEEKPPWDEMIKNDAILGDRDELSEDAIKEIKRTGKSSASHLQRALKIGYPRAARLVDELEDMGILGPVRSGGKEREILISRDEEAADGDYD